MSSLWNKTCKRTPAKPLRRDIKTDVLVIGGGLCGILCARKLTDAGVDCVLLEATRLCQGVTRDTTAKITAQHGLIYHKLLKKFGPVTARLYFEANAAALEEYRALAQDIDCGFEDKDNYIYSRADHFPLDRELDALERLGIPAQLTGTPELPFYTVGAVKFPWQAQFHPLKFAYAMAKGLKIYENTAVKEFTPHGILTDAHIITAERVVVCTHFPMLNKHGSYFVKLYQDRSYALAIQNGPHLNGMYLDQESGGLSLRNGEGHLILGGGSHRPGRKGADWAELTDAAKRFWPDKPITCRWAAQDCVTLDGMPYIGRYSARTKDLYVATGFNKWGMTSSMVAANLLTHLILGKDDPYAKVFSPSRSILRPQLVLNGVEYAADLLTPTRPRCPHMGCALQWNRAEHTWDCPCHGSRFSADGSLLDNPATDGL